MTTEIVVVSLACCAPFTKAMDDKLVANLTEAIKQVGIQAELRVLSSVDLYTAGGLHNEYISQLLPLSQQHGLAAAPTVFVNGKLIFYGVVLSADEITETLMSTISVRTPHDGT